MSNEANESPLSAREWLHRLRYQDGTRRLSRLPPVESTDWQEFLRLLESTSLEQPTNTGSASSSRQLEGPSNTPRLLGQSAYDAEDEELTEDRIIEFLIPSDDDECQDVPFPCKKSDDLPRVENETEIMLVTSLIFLDTYMQSPLFGGFIEISGLLNVAVIDTAEGLWALSKFFNKARKYVEEGIEICAVTMAGMENEEGPTSISHHLKLREIDLHLGNILDGMLGPAKELNGSVTDLRAMVHIGMKHTNSTLQLDVTPSIFTQMKAFPATAHCFTAVGASVSLIAESLDTTYVIPLAAVGFFWKTLRQQINKAFTEEVIDTHSIAKAILPHSENVYNMISNFIDAYNRLGPNVRHTPQAKHDWERLNAFYVTILNESDSSVSLFKHWGVSS